jgi:hypothetical protein
MLSIFSIFNTIFNDAPENWQLGFQDPASPGFTGIIELHNIVGFFLIIVCISVFVVLWSCIYYFNSIRSSLIHKYLNHGTLIETIWTILPALILIAIAFPSFRLMYLLDCLYGLTFFFVYVVSRRLHLFRLEERDVFLIKNNITEIKLSFMSSISLFIFWFSVFFICVFLIKGKIKNIKKSFMSSISLFIKYLNKYIDRTCFLLSLELSEQLNENLLVVVFLFMYLHLLILNLKF